MTWIKVLVSDGMYERILKDGERYGNKTVEEMVFYYIQNSIGHIKEEGERTLEESQRENEKRRKDSLERAKHETEKSKI